MFLFKPIILLQIPSEIPHPDHNKPLDFSSPLEMILYLGGPVLIFIVFIIIRKLQRRKKD